MRWLTIGGIAAVALFAASSGGSPVEAGRGGSVDGTGENRMDDLIGYGPARDYEGCTPHFWKQAQHFGSWPVDVGHDFADAFPGFCASADIALEEPNGSGACKLELLEALGLRGDGAEALTRHAAAAWLNAGSTVGFAYSPTDVEGILEEALEIRTLDGAVNGLAGANGAGCPLGRPDLTY